MEETIIIHPNSQSKDKAVKIPNPNPITKVPCILTKTTKDNRKIILYMDEMNEMNPNMTVRTSIQNLMSKAKWLRKSDGF